jgi:hypothetical protein
VLQTHDPESLEPLRSGFDDRRAWIQGREEGERFSMKIRTAVLFASLELDPLVIALVVGMVSLPRAMDEAGTDLLRNRGGTYRSLDC